MCVITEPVFLSGWSYRGEGMWGPDAHSQFTWTSCSQMPDRKHRAHSTPHRPTRTVLPGPSSVHGPPWHWNCGVCKLGVKEWHILRLALRNLKFKWRIFFDKHIWMNTKLSGWRHEMLDIFELIEMTWILNSLWICFVRLFWLYVYVQVGCVQSKGRWCCFCWQTCAHLLPVVAGLLRSAYQRGSKGKILQAIHLKMFIQMAGRV